MRSAKGAAFDREGGISAILPVFLRADETIEPARTRPFRPRHALHEGNRIAGNHDRASSGVTHEHGPQRRSPVAKISGPVARRHFRDARFRPDSDRPQAGCGPENGASEAMTPRIQEEDRPWQGESRLRRTAIALLSAGIALRIALSLSSSHVAPTSDMAQYLALARSVARGAALGSIDRALAYPVFLGGLLASRLGSLAAIYLVQSLLTLTAGVLLAILASKTGGRAAGWIALALIVPQLTVAQYSGLVLSEALFLPLFALWILLALMPGSRPAWTLVISGAAAGAATIVKPAALPLAVGTILALGVTGPRRIRSSMIFGASTAAVVFVGVQCLAAIAGTSPSIAPTLGVNLYLGNSPGARLDGGGDKTLPHDLDEIQDPRERDARARRDAIDYATSHPGRTVLLGLVRMIRLAGVNPGRIEHDALVADGLPSAVVFFWLGLEWVLVLTLLTIACASRGRAWTRLLIPPALVLAPYVVVLCSTFVQTRFRLPIHVLLLPYAATGISGLRARLSGDPALKTHLAWALAACVTVILGATVLDGLLKAASG